MQNVPVLCITPKSTQVNQQAPTISTHVIPFMMALYCRGKEMATYQLYNIVGRKNTSHDKKEFMKGYK